MTLLVGVSYGQSTKEVKECYSSYKAAIIESNGEEALKCIDKNTLGYYGKMLDISIHGDSATIQNLELMDKMMVLTIRHRIPHEEIFSQDANSLFVYAVNSGMVGKNSVAPLEIGLVEIDEDFAKGQIVSNGQPTPLNYEFNKEEGQWKLDLTAIFAPSAAALKQVIDENDQTENEFIFEILGMVTGKAVENNIWHPLK